MDLDITEEEFSPSLEVNPPPNFMKELNAIDDE